MPNELKAIIAIVVIISGAIFYIVRSRKKGVKCIGCPDGGTCKIKDFVKDLKDAKEHCCKCSQNNEN